MKNLYNILPSNCLNKSTKAAQQHENNTRGIILIVAFVDVTCYGSKEIKGSNYLYRLGGIKTLLCPIWRVLGFQNGSRLAS